MTQTSNQCLSCDTTVSKLFTQISWRFLGSKNIECKCCPPGFPTMSSAQMTYDSCLNIVLVQFNCYYCLALIHLNFLIICGSMNKGRKGYSPLLQVYTLLSPHTTFSVDPKSLHIFLVHLNCNHCLRWFTNSFWWFLRVHVPVIWKWCSKSWMMQQNLQGQSMITSTVNSGSIANK